MDFSVFDSLLDSVFVIDGDRKILYCNTAAAVFCGSSVRRLSKGQKIFDILRFSDEHLFVMPNGTQGKDSATGFTELDFEAIAAGKAGRVQIAIQPFQSENGTSQWVVLLHDVTLEEVLHRKYRGELEQKEGYIIELRKAQAELEQYSKNLEKMVEERTAEVQRANQMLSAIMNSLGQGFLVFDKDGACGSIFTKACLDILECSPSGMRIWEVLKLFGPQRDQFSKWVEASFKEALPFDNMVELAPRLFAHSQNRHITLDYYPLRSSKNEITSVVLVATDRTAEFEAGLALEREKQNAQMIMRIIRARDHFAQFLKSTRETIVRIQKDLNSSEFSVEEGEDLFRQLHTVEGEAAAYSMATVRAAARLAQDVLEPLRWGDALDRQGVQRLSNAIRDLGSTFNQFLAHNQELFDILGLEKGRKVELPYNKVLAFRHHLERHGLAPRLLQDFDDDFLRVPLKSCLRPLEETAIVVASKQSKMLKPFVFETGAVHVIVDNFENLFSSLVHAVRNSVDHGLEDPNERVAAGKPGAGQIIVRAQWVLRNSGRWLKLEIQDDGRGIDADKIRAKLDQRYPSVNWQEKSDHDVIQHVFDAGLSSREDVGEFSGRGIGMDAILTEARHLGGEASIESEVGKGTTLVIEIPDQPLKQSMRVGA